MPEYYRWPGDLSPSLGLKFTDVPNGLKAAPTNHAQEPRCWNVPVQALSVVPKEGWAQMLAFAGFLELVVNKKTSEPGWSE